MEGDGGEGWRGMEGRDGGGMEGRDGGGGPNGRREGEGVVLGLVVVRRRVVVLFRHVVLAVSSSRVPVDVSSLSRCFHVGHTLLCGKRLQVVVVVFVRGGSRFCVGIRPRLWAVVFVVWAVVAVRRWWVIVGIGRLTAGRCGGCCRVAVVVCRRSVVCWCVSWIG